MIGTRSSALMKNVTSLISLSNKTLEPHATGYVLRTYSKEKGTCCRDVVQTEGKKVEPWPKVDPPPRALRCECPKESQPVNYDLYRIKVPDVIVPPLPPSNAKEVPNEDARELFKNPVNDFGVKAQSHVQDLFHNFPIVHPDYWKDRPEKKITDVKEVLPKLGYHGRNKFKYAFHEPWNPLDRMGLLELAEKQELGKQTEDALVNTDKQTGPDHLAWRPRYKNEFQPMLDCTKTKGPCSVQPAPDPPPCPPPPPKPFPWIYVIAIGSFFSLMGLMYKLYLWKEEHDTVSDSAPIWCPRRKVKRPLYIEDLPACVQYLIVGTGAAGWAAYRAIMEHDKKAKVFFITKEDILPYRRPPMSKHMWWNPEPPDIKHLNYIEDSRRKTMYLSESKTFMDPVKFYRKKTGPAVSIACGWCVQRVDAENHAVYLKGQCGEQPIYYERCLLAPGSKAKQMSIFKSAPKPVRERVCTLRTIRDLEIAYRKVKKAKHVVIIGGGCLGCELAWHLGRMNKVVQRGEDEEPIKFVHIFKDKGVLSDVLPEYLGEWAAEKIKCEDVTQMSKTQVYDAFESPDGRLELTLSNGQSLVTDYVFVAIGAVPEIELAEPSFLEVDPINGGFVVNTELEARKHLYVAGDAASVYSQWHDTRLRMQHYINAEEQGFVAGANMAGHWIPSNMEPHWWVELGEALSMEVVGEVGACMPTVGIFKRCEDERAAQESPAVSASGDRPCYKKSAEYQNRYKRGMLFYLRDETIAGMVFWNMPPIDDRKEVVTEMLRARPTYKDINLLAEQLGFADTKCVYKSDEELKEPGPCINRRRVF